MAEDATPRDSTRRYTAAQKAEALLLVRQLRTQLGRTHGTVLKVADLLGYGRETVRAWVREADISDAFSDGAPDAARIAMLEREIERLKSQNEALRRAARSAGSPPDYDMSELEHDVNTHRSDLLAQGNRDRLGLAV